MKTIYAEHRVAKITATFRAPMTIAMVWLMAWTVLGCSSKPSPSDQAKADSPPSAPKRPTYDLTIKPRTETPTEEDVAKPEPKLVGTENVEESYPGGAVKWKYQAKIFSDGSKVPDGASLEMFEDGTIFRQGRYQDGVRVGPWIFNHPSGELAKQGEYREGQPDGEWWIYNKDGSKRRHENYKLGKPHGDWTFYRTGEIVEAEEHFKDGKWHGLKVSYYPSGQISMSSEYTDGKLDGVARRFFEDGKQKTEETYVDGKRHGRSVSWTATGEIVAEVEFREGVRQPTTNRL